MVRRQDELTFKYNLDQGRHRWLRLTPAYSVRAVQRFMDTPGQMQYILDPFAGSGTTGLVCAEAGIRCDLVELNPFLVWLSAVKARNYAPRDIRSAQHMLTAMVEVGDATPPTDLWTPPIRNIDRWWSADRLRVLAWLNDRIGQLPSRPAKDLLLVAFCRLAIEWSNAAFNHQSMSFNDGRQPSLFDVGERTQILESYRTIAHQIIQDAVIELPVEPRVVAGDSRRINRLIQGPYSGVITSPPYPNRISYIRELRPYMYWLGYLQEAWQAGELDWQAIGGTWGVATSRLSDWQPDGRDIEHTGFDYLIDDIASTKRPHSRLLATYVHRYFVDMLDHFTGLAGVLAPGARVVYIVGNSKFYDTLVPVEQIYASLMRQCGLVNISIEVLRKRNSKKELREFAVIGYAA